MRTIDKRRFFAQLGYTPHIGQEQIHAALSMPGIDQVVAMCGSRFGKTWAAAYEMAYEAMLPRADFMGWCVGPSTKVADAIFDMVTQIMAQIHGNDLRLDRNDGTMEFRNFGGGRSRIMRRTTQGAKGKARLAAYAVDFMVCDEASDPEFHDSVWETQLRTRLINRQGKLLAISTPRGQRGWFVALHRLTLRTPGGRGIACNFPTWLNNVDYPGGFNDPKIQKEYRSMALRDFLQEYGAQPMSAEGAIFDPEIIDASCVLDGWEDPIAAGEYASGYDIGLKRDSSVHTIVRAPLGFANASKAAKVVFVRRMHKMPVEAQLELVLQDQERYGIQSVYTDGTGLGAPIVQQARNMGIFVRSVTFSTMTKMPMIINLRGLLEQRKLRLPKALVCPALRDQLLTYEWDKNGKTANAPEGFHDDYVASLALACKFFPAIMSEGDGQAFHVNKPGEVAKRVAAHEHLRKFPKARAHDAEQPSVRVIRPATPEEVQTFTQKRPGAGGLRWGNDVVG